MTFEQDDIRDLRIEIDKLEQENIKIHRHYHAKLEIARNALEDVITYYGGDSLSGVIKRVNSALEKIK